MYFLLFQSILAPQGPFYTNIAKDCVANGVSVDLFLFPNSYIDVATIGLLATQTGGQIYRYSYFKVCSSDWLDTELISLVLVVIISRP